MEQILVEFPAIVSALSTVMMRPIGLTMGFLPLMSVLGTSVMLRMAIALGLSLPIFSANYASLLQISSTPMLEKTVFLATEFMIGGVLGLVCSAPFWTVRVAGGLIDAYRGEANPSTPADGMGDILTTTANVYNAAGLLIFAAASGFWLIAHAFYNTYRIWPLFGEHAAANIDFGVAALAFVDEIFSSMFALAAPILIMMMTTEFIVIFSSKLSRKMNVSSMSFMAKNTVAMFMTPIFLFFLSNSFYERIMDLFSQRNMLEGFLK